MPGLSLGGQGWGSCRTKATVEEWSPGWGSKMSRDAGDQNQKWQCSAQLEVLGKVHPEGPGAGGSPGMVGTPGFWDWVLLTCSSPGLRG